MTPDWLQPMPWLQMQQSNSPTLGQGISTAIGSLGPAIYNRMNSRGINPPARKYKTLTRAQIAEKAGNYANSVAGEPPPMY